MFVRLLPVMLVGLSGRFCLGRVANCEFFLLVSWLTFRMFVGLGFIVSSFAAMLVAVGPVLMSISAMRMRCFLLTSIRGASCSQKGHKG